MQAIALQDMRSQPSAWLNEKLQWDYARYHKKINIKVKFNIKSLKKSTFMFIFAAKIYVIWKRTY